MDVYGALHRVAQRHCLPITLPADAPTAGGRFGLEELPVLPRRFQATSTLFLKGSFVKSLLQREVSSEYREALDVGAWAVLLCTDRPPHYVADPYPKDVATLAAADLQSPSLTDPLFLTPHYELRIARAHQQVAETSYRFTDGGIEATRAVMSRLLPPLTERDFCVRQDETQAIIALAGALHDTSGDALAPHVRRERIVHQ